MKKDLFVLLFLLLLFPLFAAFAQGSERIYLDEPFTFQGATDLPDGGFCFAKYGEDTYDISIADANGDIVANIPLFELFFTEVEQYIIYDFSEFILNADGSVTAILGVNGTDYVLPLEVFWVNYDPGTATINWTNVVDVSEVDGGSDHFRGDVLFFRSTEYSKPD